MLPSRVGTCVSDVYLVSCGASTCCSLCIVSELAVKMQTTRPQTTPFLLEPADLNSPTLLCFRARSSVHPRVKPSKTATLQPTRQQPTRQLTLPCSRQQPQIAQLTHISSNQAQLTTSGTRFPNSILYCILPWTHLVKNWAVPHNPRAWYSRPPTLQATILLCCPCDPAVHKRQVSLSVVCVSLQCSSIPMVCLMARLAAGILIFLCHSDSRIVESDALGWCMPSPTLAVEWGTVV